MKLVRSVLALAVVGAGAYTSEKQGPQTCSSPAQVT